MVEPWKAPTAASADSDLGVGKEGIGWQRQVQRCRSDADAARRIILRAVAGAEPAVIVALVGERDAAEMRAVAVDHQPLIMALLDARLVRLRIGKAVPVDGPRLVDLLLG